MTETKDGNDERIGARGGRARGMDGAISRDGQCGPACGDGLVAIAQTLRAVQRVEVTANDEPAGRVGLSDGRIEFAADDAKEREMDPRPARRRGAARGGRDRAPGRAGDAASRRVDCEFSARYQLTLCY